MNEFQEALILLILITSPIIILIILINEFLGGLVPCQAKKVIEDILNHNGYVSGYKKEKLRELLIYEYKYNRCDRYTRLLRKFKELEKEIY